MRSIVLAVCCLGCVACDRTRLVPAYSASTVEVVACATGDFTLEPATPEVMLVLDRSTSMSTALGTGTRWSTVESALEFALPPVDAQMALGLTLFPAASRAGLECVVPDAPALFPATDQVGRLLATLRSTSLVGGTPTALALDVAASGLTSSGPRAMVLATDGVPNCNSGLNAASCACPTAGTCATASRCIDDARTLDRLSAHADEGIPTWVIGIGGDVTSSALLDAMALAGGRPAAGARKYLAATSPLELQQAFVDIRDELSACVFTSPSAPDAAGSASLQLDGVTVPRDDSGTNGWSWSSQSRGELVLRGDWCLKARLATTPVVRLSVTCGAEVVEPAAVIQ